MLNLAARLAAGAYLLVAVVLMFGVVGGFAAEPCAGSLVTVSWYGKETCHGRPPGHGRGKCETAAGVAFDGSQMLVAHRTLPFGTRVRFTTSSGKSLVLPVLDRGPWMAGRAFDLSHAAAASMGLIAAGVGRVCAARVR
jgi:rare lipoprotein A